jgi:glycine cleavage system transcriptional repressor
MKRHAIVTAIGTDRVGIVDDLTASILEESCNIEESRMAVLGTEFAVMLLLSGEAEAIGRLSERLPAAGEKLGLHVAVKQTAAPRADPALRPYLVESISLDTPGIVHAITSLLRRYRINIENLETDTTAAPWTGAPMFTMKARVSVPSAVSLAELREELEKLEAEANLDVRLTPVTVTPGEP